MTGDIKKIFVVAGEHSGDALGGKIMSSLKEASAYELAFQGVGGEAMGREGLQSIFPMSDVAVMGIVDIAKALPRIVRRVYQCVDAVIAMQPDLLLIIDSPEFTHPIAKRVRKALPSCPILNYVSPTVWAWRPGRAKKMQPYVDHVLALLPFEPAAHERLGGPKCSYVGHPMIEKIEWMRSRDHISLRDKLKLNPDHPVLVVLPGSRPNEVTRLMKPFGQAIEKICTDLKQDIEVIIPVVPSVQHLIEKELTQWKHGAHLVFGEEDKFASFKLAQVALAASGTVSLELALAGTPMVIGYKADPIMALFRGLVQVPSVVLANLVLEENIFEEFLQNECKPNDLSRAVLPLISNTPKRQKQIHALERLEEKMILAKQSNQVVSPSDAAAQIILDYLPTKTSA
ncbi:MAG: lipid-A-disaccharide synthase [Pseudomonadota bacterium]